MITFIDESKNKTIFPTPLENTKLCDKILFDKCLPVLNSPFTINGDKLFNYLSNNNGELKDIDFYFLIGLLNDIDIKELIRNFTIMHNYINSPTDIDEIKEQYKKFILLSKMKFPYNIDLYISNYIIRIMKNSVNIINALNYCAFVSNSKSEIDDSINKDKNLLKYELWLSNKTNNNLEEMIHLNISPFNVPMYFDYSTSNNPFHTIDDYILCLLTPYKFKLNNLREIKSIFNTENNKLYKLMLEGGYNQLQKEVLTYRAKDIINLFLVSLYAAHIIIEYNLLYSKELHEVAFFIYNETQCDTIHEPQVLIPYSVHESFRLLEIDNPRNKMYSFEAQNSMQDNVRLNDIDEQYKRKWAQLQKIYIKIFKVGISKIYSKVNSLFFKKYYGRIPHLYSEYGNKAIIVENKMVGDPGRILSTIVSKYIEKMSDDATGIFNDLLQLARRLTSTTNIKEKINVVKSYCTKIKIDDTNIDSIKKAIVYETRFRIASSILQDNTIYGFTVDGIMHNKKFPPANHIVTSLFVKNPHEQPVEQRVSEIFDSDDSLLMFAYPEKVANFNNIYRQNASKIIDTFNPKVASMTEKNMTKAAKRYSYQLMNNTTQELNNAEETNPKEQQKISNMIDRAVVHAIDMAIEQKRRCIQCTGIAHDMIGRVTDLAKRCIIAMLEVEKKLTDPAYKTGLKQNKNSAINKQNKANSEHIKRQNETVPRKKKTSRDDTYNSYGY
jgi:hypothetical protein